MRYEERWHEKRWNIERGTERARIAAKAEKAGVEIVQKIASAPYVE